MQNTVQTEICKRMQINVVRQRTTTWSKPKRHIPTVSNSCLPSPSSSLSPDIGLSSTQWHHASHSGRRWWYLHSCPIRCVHKNWSCPLKSSYCCWLLPLLAPSTAVNSLVYKGELGMGASTLKNCYTSSLQRGCCCLIVLCSYDVIECWLMWYKG